MSRKIERLNPSTARLRRWSGLLAAAMLACLVAGGAQAQTVLVPGFSIEEVASGLNGPEGMVPVGSSKVVVAEAQNVPPGDPVNRVLTRVKRNGKTKVLAQVNGLQWINVGEDPWGGYLAAQFGTPNGGVQEISRKGVLGNFYATGGVPGITGNLIGVVADPVTGDIFAAATSGSILRIDRAGNISEFKDRSVRADGLQLTDDRILLAAVRFRVDGGGNLCCFNQVEAWDIDSGAETVLATSVGTRIDFVAQGENGGPIYVSDAADGMIRRLVDDGAGGFLVEDFAAGFSTTSVAFPGLSFNSVAVARDGDLWVADYGAGKIYALDRDDDDSDSDSDADSDSD